MSRELKLGERFGVLLDPLSHGGNMTSYQLELEVVARETVESLAVGEEETRLDIAVCKIYFQMEVELGVPNKQSFEGNWSALDGLEVLVRADGEEWRHTAWPVDVDFIEEGR